MSVADRTLLGGVDLRVAPAASVAVMGPSGSGKTTLLHCLSGLRRPDAGCVRLGGVDITGLSDRERAAVRLRRIGSIFQFGELLPELTVRENVELPLRLAGRSPGSSATELLAAVGLGSAGDRFPVELSGGERQRVGIARALSTEPEVILADEPTGALDVEQSAAVCDLIVERCRERGAALVVATHDLDVAGRCDATYRLAGARFLAT